jgi:hypothetical protein
MERSIYHMHECREIQYLLANVSHQHFISRNQSKPNGTLVVNSISFKSVRYRRHCIPLPFQLLTICTIFMKWWVYEVSWQGIYIRKILAGHTVKAGLYHTSWTKVLLWTACRTRMTDRQVLTFCLVKLDLYCDCGVSAGDDRFLESWNISINRCNTKICFAKCTVSKDTETSIWHAITFRDKNMIA